MEPRRRSAWEPGFTPSRPSDGLPTSRRRGRATIGAPSGQPPRTGERAGPTPLMRALPRPRLWPTIGHSAMPGAIRAAFGRLEPAIGEIHAPRIAEGPSAGESANVLEPHPQHLTNLRLGK